MKVNDAVSGAVCILFGGLLFYLTRGYPTMPGQNYGADLFPRLIASGMILGGLVLVWSGIRDRGVQPWFQLLDWMQSPRHIANFALMITVLVFYILVSDWLGFAVTAFICLMAMLLWLRGLRNWLSATTISVASVIVINLFFGQFLRVPLPWGIFEAYAW